MAIHIERIVQKEDEFLSKNDYSSAEKLLLYWLNEADRSKDERCSLALCNELMGLYRKTGIDDKAKDYALQAVNIVHKLDMDDTVTGATSFLNAGTVYKAVGEPEKSLEFFELAKNILDKPDMSDSGRKAGLYNNMGLTLIDLGRFSEAAELFISAIELSCKDSPQDAAISCLNLADCFAWQYGTEQSETKIHMCLDRAERLLSSVSEEKKNGAYAYACEKCAPVFDYYGYFIFADELRRTAEKIYRH